MPRPKGGYKNSKGGTVPGCTTIISRFKESGPLLYWAFEQGKAGAHSLYEKADEAADIGTFAHALFEAHRKKWPVPKPPDGMTPAQVDRAETAYLNAMRWADHIKVETIATEQTLVCECHQYGCTLDEIAKLDGQFLDMEWKTSNGVYVDHLLQVAAQKHAWECNFPEMKLGGAGIVRFSKDTGDFAYHFFTDLTEPFEQFVDFCHCYKRDYRLKRRVR